MTLKYAFAYCKSEGLYLERLDVRDLHFFNPPELTSKSVTQLPTLRLQVLYLSYDN